MKLVAIGDIHSRPDWKKIVEDNPDADKIVFIGDYLDSYDISPYKQLYNFNEIIALKRANPDRIVLLIGNHDEHYRYQMVINNHNYSGFQGHMTHLFSPLVEELIHKREMQVAFFHENYIFSHAGLTETWMNDHGVTESNINELLITNQTIFSFLSGGLYSYPDPYGDDVFQGPLWVRSNSLYKDGYKRDTHIHVVGHTSVPQIRPLDHLCLIDCLEHKQYVTITDGLLEVKTYE